MQAVSPSREDSLKSVITDVTVAQHRHRGVVHLKRVTDGRLVPQQPHSLAMLAGGGAGFALRPI